jgi:alpha-tubulin suppressor-like RCC1 family protein
MILMLISCGGSSKDLPETTSTGYSAAPTLTNTSATFSGVRAKYSVETTSEGILVKDIVTQEGSILVSSKTDLLVFKDISTNQSISKLALEIPAKDLVSIVELYIAYFNRVPDASGLSYWIKEYKRGLTLDQIGESFYSAGVQYSAVTGYSSTMSNSDFVTIIYKNVLGRPYPDKGGLDYWSSALENKSATRGTLVRSMLNSAHTFKGDAIYGWVAEFLDKKYQVANYFSVQQGISYNDNTESITQGMEILALVSPTSSSSALGYIDELLGKKPPTVKSGVFRDSVVQGIRFVATAPNGLQRSGVTDAQGEYSYFEGGKIDFYLGNILLASVNNPSATTVTAFLAKDPAANNIARLLQTLDEDNDPSNGIVLTTQVQTNAQKIQNLDFSAQDFDVKFSAIKNTLMANTSIPISRDLVTTEAAAAHAENGARFAFISEKPLGRALQGKLSYPSSYNQAALKKSEYQRLRLYVWEHLERPNLDLAIRAINGKVNGIDAGHELVESTLKRTTAVLDTLNIVINAKDLIVRGADGLSTARKLVFAVSKLEDSGSSGCSVALQLVEEGVTKKVNVNPEPFCTAYEWAHGKFVKGDDANSKIINDALNDAFTKTETEVFNSMNRNWLLKNSFTNGVSLSYVDQAKYAVKVAQIINDGLGSYTLSSNTKSATSHLIARMYLDTWARSAGDRAFMTKLISGQTGVTSINRNDDIAALIKFYSTTGLWCDVQSFIYDNFISGIDNLFEGKIALGKTCQPNVDLDLVNRVIDASVVSMSQQIAMYKKTLGPFALSSTESGTFDIPLVINRTSAITQVLDDVGTSTGSITLGGTTDDSTPTLSGTISPALAAGETLALFNGSTKLGNANVNGTYWTFTPLELTTGNYTFSSAVVSTGGVEGQRSNTWNLIISSGCSFVPCTDDGSVTTFSAGEHNSLALKSDGTLWVAGSNQSGSLGTGDGTYRLWFTQVLSGVKSVSAGGFHSLALKSDGSLWATGENFVGQLGTGDNKDRNQFTQVLSGVKSISAGERHSLALKSDGTLWVCGLNVRGQLGTGDTIHRNQFIQVLSGVSAISAGAFHSLALKSDGTLWATGGNFSGTLGSGDKVDRNQFIQVLTDVTATSAGYHHSLALKGDGTLWGSGFNSGGTLGTGDNIDRNQFTLLLNQVSRIAAGADFSLVLRLDGTLWASGINYYGQLGTGDSKNRNQFVSVLSGVSMISAGYQHSLILKQDGSLWGSGHNHWGVFGTGDSRDSNIFIKILNGVRTPVLKNKKIN